MQIVKINNFVLSSFFFIKFNLVKLDKVLKYLLSLRVNFNQKKRFFFFIYFIELTLKLKNLNYIFHI